MRWTILILILLAAIGSADAATLDRPIYSGSNIIIRSVDYNPFPVAPGDSFELMIAIKNNDQSRILSGATLTISETFPFSISNEDTKVKSITNLLPGQETRVKFIVDVKDNSATGNNVLSLQYREMIGSIPGPLYTFSPINIEVQRDETLGSGSLSVTEARTVPSNVEPGKKVKLILKVKNTGSFLMRDVDVKLNLNNLPFTPIDTSTNQRIRSIATDSSVDLEFNVIVDADAALKAYKIPVAINFKDDLGQKFSINDTIGITIESKPEYLLGIEESKVYSSGDSGKIVVSMSNIGSSDMKFANVELLQSDDYEILSATKSYLGNLEPDDFETADFEVHVIGEGKQAELKFEISYKDAYNKEYVETRMLAVPLYTRSQLAQFGLLTGNGKYTFIIYLFIAIVIYLLIREWIKHKDLNLAFQHTFKKIVWFFISIVMLLNPRHLKKQVSRLIRFLRENDK